MRDNSSNQEYITRVKKLLEQSNITGHIDIDTILFDKDTGKTPEECAQLFEDEYFKNEEGHINDLEG